jgi:predicted Zn-dependent protease
LLGAAHFRAGQLDVAVERLNEAARQKKDSPMVWLYLALAHYQRGQAAEARTSLARAVQAIERFNTAKSRPGVAKLPWTERLSLQLLRLEAEQVIGTKLGDQK